MVCSHRCPLTQTLQPLSYTGPAGELDVTLMVLPLSSTMGQTSWVTDHEFQDQTVNHRASRQRAYPVEGQVSSFQNVPLESLPEHA